MFHRYLKHLLLNNEIFIANDGHGDENTVLHYEAVELAEYYSEIRARHETVNMRLKQFRVISANFWDDISMSCQKLADV